MAAHPARVRRAIPAVPVREVRSLARRAVPRVATRRSRATGVNDAIARDRELFSRIAETHPGIVRTLDVLIGELDAADLDPETLRQLGDRVRRIGNKLIERAGRMIIDPEAPPA